MTKIAIPITENMLSRNFEDCYYYLIYRINLGKLIGKPVKVYSQDSTLNLSEWIKEWEITDVIANGMNKLSINYFSETKINLFIGVEINTPEKILEEYLMGTLKSNTKNIIKSDKV